MSLPRRFLLLLPLVLLARPADAGERLDDAARSKAARRAVAYLEKQVFRLPESAGTPRKPFTTAIAGLCFLMEGRTRTGPDRVRRVREYLEKYVERVEAQVADPKNLPPRHGLASSSYVVQYTWPVAAAGLFFAELEARGRPSKKATRTVLKLLLEAQQENGGWGHGRIHAGNKDPFAGRLGLKGMGGYPDTLCSSSNVVAITVGTLQAMGHDTGDVVTKARSYFRKARLDNGSFPYDPSQRQSGFAKTNVGRTAGSLYAWHCLGMPRDGDFDGSVAYLKREFAWIPEGHGSPCLNVMHGALLCHMLGRETWLEFREAFEPRILKAQDESGALGCICEQKAFGVTCDSKQVFMGILGEGQKVYTTALHAFVLLLDREELKSLERRKPGAPITKSGRR